MKCKLSWIWKLAAALAALAAVACGAALLARSLKKKDDQYSWPNDEEYMKTNEKSWSCC